jgi:LuxR family transcriptional regulator, activator of conjugal transfer of Ti plasmids
MPSAFRAFVECLNESRSTADIHSAAVELTGALEIANFAYVAKAGIICDRPVVITNYPKAWLGHYRRKHYEVRDPVLTIARREREPFRWGPGHWPVVVRPPDDEIVVEGQSFGIKQGYTVPVIASGETVGSMTFSTAEDEDRFVARVDKLGAAFELVAAAVHHQAREVLTGWPGMKGVRPTPRELQCLEWAAQGKSAWEIGQLLSISETTVRFHLKGVREKLGVRTTHQAIAIWAAAKSK